MKKTKEAKDVKKFDQFTDVWFDALAEARLDRESWQRLFQAVNRVPNSDNLEKLQVAMGQEMDLGRKTNQHFQYIPFHNFMSKIQYKAELAGIEVVFTEPPHSLGGDRGWRPGKTQSGPGRIADLPGRIRPPGMGHFVKWIIQQSKSIPVGRRIYWRPLRNSHGSKEILEFSSAGVASRYMKQHGLAEPTYRLQEKK